MKKLDFGAVQAIVEYDNTYDKQRLNLKCEDNVWKIRANQGHSISGLDEEQIFVEVFEPFPICLHATDRKFLASIQKTGLCKMGRTHIHCVYKHPIGADKPISGFKKQSNCVISIDMQKSLLAGHRWFLSQNEVLLTEGPIMPEFFLEIKDL